MSGKLTGVLKGLQKFRDSVEDLPPSDFKYKKSGSKKSGKDSSSDDFLSKFLSRIDKDPALRERIKSEFSQGKRGLFTEKALQEYRSGKGELFKRLNPTAEEVSRALSKKKPVKHKKGGMASKIKEKSVSGQVKLLNKSRRSAERTEKKLRSMGDELDLIKKTKTQLEKHYGTKARKPVKKAKGGLATSRSRKPRGVGKALRGYGKAMK